MQEHKSSCSRADTAAALLRMTTPLVCSSTSSNGLAGLTGAFVQLLQWYFNMRAPCQIQQNVSAGAAATTYCNTMRYTHVLPLPAHLLCGRGEARAQSCTGCRVCPNSGHWGTSCLLLNLTPQSSTSRLTGKTGKLPRAVYPWLPAQPPTNILALAPPLLCRTIPPQLFSCKGEHIPFLQHKEETPF